MRPPRPNAPALHRLGLPSPASRLAIAIVAVFVVGAASFIGAAREGLDAAKAWVVGSFDWLFVGVATAAVVLVLGLAIHPRANVRLGRDDEAPEFGTLSWFAMLFSAGLASGLLYWATAEPILHHQSNPFTGAGLPSAGASAREIAMHITVLHWGVHGWAFYVLAALCIAVYSYRHGQALSFRTALYPLLGPDRIDRWPGVAVDLLALFGTVCGVATSIGLSAGALNATLGALLGLEVNTSNQIAIVFGVCVLGVLSALSGLARGIRRLSELNVWVSAVLLGALIALGPTLFLGELFGRTLFDYLLYGLPSGTWLGTSSDEKAWQASWTVFYWGWWLAWTPFVSLFIARISKGRTVREFCVAVMLAPTLVTLLWMSVFGGTALFQEAANPGLISGPVNEDYSLGIVAVFQNLASPPIAQALMLMATFLLFTWLITSLDSATLVICHLVGTEDVGSAKVMWGLALAAVSAVLLRVGGLSALQAASIVVGLPLAGAMVLLGGGLLFDLTRGRL